jgi:hypothetical protein
MKKIHIYSSYSYTTEYPDMAYTSQGKLTFLTRHVDKKEWIKPSGQLLKASIHLGYVRALFLLKHLSSLIMIEKQKLKTKVSTHIHRYVD